MKEAAGGEGKNCLKMERCSPSDIDSQRMTSRVRSLLTMPNASDRTQPSAAREEPKPALALPYPRCGGLMIVVETFEGVKSGKPPTALLHPSVGVECRRLRVRTPLLATAAPANPQLVTLATLAGKPMRPSKSP